MRRLSPLGLRIFGFSALAIGFSLGAALLVVGQVARRTADRSIERALGAGVASIEDKLAARSQTLRATTEKLAEVPTTAALVERALEADDRSTLLDAANELKTRLGAEWVLLTNATGILAAWSDRPEIAAIDLSGGALIDLALQGAATEGVWLEPTERGPEAIYQAVSVPLRAPGRPMPLGAVVAALPIDSSLAATLKRNTDSDVFFFTRDSVWAPVGNVSTSSPAQALASIGADTLTRRVSFADDQGEWVGAVGILRTASGAPVAGFVGLRSRSEELAPFLRLQRVITLSLIGGLILALLASAWLARRISLPVLGLVKATRRVGEGDYRTPVAIDSADEIGELGRAFQRMVDELEEKQRLVDYLSSPRGGTLPGTDPIGAPLGAPLGDAGPIAIGSVLANRYELKEVLGAGGMGVVYRAFDRELKETVALKTLHPSVEQSDQGFMERFKQEIRLARRITHRNVVRTHDLGESNGSLFLTMELVEGTPLDQLIERRGKLPLEVTLPIVKQLLRALEVAHEVGVIHRDIKPGNLIVQTSGVVKVMDFGIARLTEGQLRSRTALTQAGSFIGSPDYMAPEQLLGEVVDQRVDLYSTGCVMFECLTGRRVFEAPHVMALIARHLDNEGPDPTTLAGLPPPVAAVVLRALAKDRSHRWPSAEVMLGAVEALG